MKSKMVIEHSTSTTVPGYLLSTFNMLLVHIAIVTLTRTVVTLFMTLIISRCALWS